MELILTDWHWAYLPIIFFAYIIFGLSGFGTTLIAAPWLSLYLPLNHIIPMIVILDAIASFKNWIITLVCNNTSLNRKPLIVICEIYRI